MKHATQAFRALVIALGMAATIGFGLCGVLGLTVGLYQELRPREGVEELDLSGLYTGCGLVGILISLVGGFIVYRFLNKNTPKEEGPP